MKFPWWHGASAPYFSGLKLTVLAVALAAGAMATGRSAYGQAQAHAGSAAAAAPAVPADVDSDSDHPGQQREFENGADVLGREHWFHDQRAYPNKHIPPGARYKALQQKNAKLAAESAARVGVHRPGRPPQVPAWSLIGPMPVNEGAQIDAGRVTALALDTTDTTWKTVYAGGAEGGVWKTTNGGATWTPLTDTQMSLAIGSIALDPSNHMTVYAGTGEENFSVDSYYGAGVLKSTNGGTTWTLMPGPFVLGGMCSQGNIGGIAVEAGSSGQVVLAAANCNASGIYRSADGGNTWTQTLSAYSGTTVFFDPNTPTTAYAATGYIFGGSPNGIYKSTDAGVTWTAINGTGSNVLPLANAGRFALAIAPSNSQIMYVAITDNGEDDGGDIGRLWGIYQTTNGGTDWTYLPNVPNFCTDQCWYDLAVAVDPVNSSVVYAGGSSGSSPAATIIVSLDGGNTWTNQYNGIHVDTHAFTWSPDGSTLYTGNDGGIWSTTDPTSTGSQTVPWTDQNATLAITEPYPGISIDPANINISFMGTQDNETENYTGSNEWVTVACGDGGPTLIDQVNPNNVYANCIENSLYKSTTGGSAGSFTSATNGINPNDPTAWIPPLAMDPENTQTLYFGTQYVYQTTNGAGLWTEISPNLTNGGTLSAIAVAPTNSNYVYAGSGDSNVWATTTATEGSGANWTQVSGPSLYSGLPQQRYITDIAVDPHAPATAYIGFSGFTGYPDSLGHIFQTTDGGDAWTDISGDLPNTPVDWIIVDPKTAGTIYIGTDIGAYYTSSYGTSWSVLGAGLPNVAVTGLVLFNGSPYTLRASTHGRSVWDLPLAGLPAAPDITSLSPDSEGVGSPSFLLTVNGGGFDTTSTVEWNGSVTGLSMNHYVNSSQLTVMVSASLLSAAGAFPVTVINDSGPISNAVNFTVGNPVPVINSLSPTSVIAGSSSFTLTVNGSSFVSSSLVQWNEGPLATTFVNSGQVTATVPASDVANAGTAQVTVMNPAPGGGTSNALTFTIDNPAPTTLSISPSSAGAGGAQFTLTVNGTNFVSSSSVQWNGTGLATAFVNGGQVTATVPASDIANGGTTQVTVLNPAPGGGTSNAQTFTIDNPVPTATSLSPTKTTAGGAQFTLTLNGTNFVSTSEVQWNGSARTTAYVSSKKVTATITATDIANGGTATVTVLNPAPGGGTSNGLTFTIDNPVPTATKLTPSSTLAGGSAFTLTVTGTNFVSSSVVEWNGSARVTTYSSSTSLTAAITAADIATAGTAMVTVLNPAPGGGTSHAQTFTIDNPVPTAGTLMPSSATAGGAQFTLTVTGTNFVSGSVVKWKGTSLATAYVSGTKLTATVPASDIAAAGTATVTVTNSSPGGGTSNSLTFTIDNPVPTASTLTPSSAMEGGAQFTLTVTGTNFVTTSTVKWNGASLATTFVSATKLTATVPATDIAKAGTASVTVFNGTPGGGTSNALTFTIDNPSPSITNISPTSTTAGGAQFTLTVNGTGFISGGASGSEVDWNGTALSTKFVSSIQLTATVPSTDIKQAGTATVTVVTAGPGGGTSDGVTFTIDNPVPVLSSLMPSSTEHGGSAFTLTIHGTGFVSGSQATWNGSDRTTTYVSAGEVQAAITAADIANAGTAQVEVVNGPPGGGTSNALTFTIN
jgi:photosystem II stability/assembly factor-like uncharacterized protein